jgi:hypothetical protein
MLTRGALTVVVLLAASRSVSADDAAEIKKLIPSASAMKRADFERLVSAAAPRVDLIEEKTLTLMILSIKITSEEAEKKRDEFQFLTEGGAARASDLANEIYRATRIGKFRLVTSPVTAIHADRIADLTCEVRDATAEGVVSFAVPKLYQGKARYLARRSNGKWCIDEFMMPAHGIHVVRNAKNHWVAAGAER